MSTAHRAIPSEPKRWNRRFLFWTLFLLVGFAPLILGLFCCDRLISRWLGWNSPDLLFAPMLFSLALWFLPPGVLIGEPVFQIGAMGAYPRGAAGWIITPLFYTMISLGLWGISLLISRRRFSSAAHSSTSR